MDWVIYNTSWGCGRSRMLWIQGEKELVNKTWEGGVGKYMNKEAREKGLGGEYVGRWCQ